MTPDEVITLFVYTVIFSLPIAVWAHYWGRNVSLWFIFSMFFSPIIAAIILAVTGKSIEKKAEEINKLKELTKDK